MTSNVAEFVVRIKNEGLNNLERVIEELNKAGVETGEFSREAQELQKRLADIERQQQLIDTFVGIKREVAAAGAAMEAAQSNAQRLGRELATTEQPTKKQEADFRRARDAVTQAKDAYQAAQLGLQGMRGQLSQAGIATTDLAQKQVALRSGTREVESAIAGATNRLRELSAGGPGAVGLIGSAINKTATETERYRRTLEQASQASDKMGASASGAAGLLRNLGPQLAAAFSAKHIIDLLISTEALDRSFNAIFGSAQRARAEMDFIRATGNRLGLENLELAKSYQSIAAATKGTALEGQATRDVFEAVARAMSTLGKGSAETERALTAISQIASKGTASMEELRGQLGEALPGALQAAAAGAGITVEQLTEMVSSGEVLAKDILPALTKGLNDLYANGAPPQTIMSEWARLKNEISDVGKELNDGGASQGLASLLSVGVEGFRRLHAATQETGEAFGEIAFMTVEASKNAAAYADQALGLSERLNWLAKAAGLAAAEQQKLDAAHQASAKGAQENFRAQELVAQKQGQVAESALKVAASYSQAINEQAKATALAEKQVAARTAEADVLVKLVGIYGTEVERHEAAAESAARQAGALDRLAQSQDAEAIIAQSYALKLKEQALATNDVTEATKRQIQEAEKNAREKQAEFERTKALSEAKKLEAEATKAQALAIKDNSDKVYQYRAAVADATTAVARLTELERQGKPVTEELRAARTGLATATSLYRDALADAARQAEINITSTRRQAELGRATLTLEQERVKAALEVAEANGKTSTAAILAAQATELQARATREQIEASRNEAEAIRTAADKKEALALATGGLTAQVKEELAAMRQSADIKELDAQRAEILAQKTRDLANSEAGRQEVLERTIAAEERRVALIERAAELERKRLGIDKEGFSVDKSGNRIVQEVDTRQSVTQRLMDMGLSQQDAERGARRVIDDRGNANLRSSGVYQEGDTLAAVLQKLVDRLQGSGANAIGGARTINVQLGGNPVGTIRTDAEGENTIDGFMRALQTAKSTAAG